MPTKHDKMPQTFPHKVIFVAAITLCFCAVGGIAVALLAWNNKVWGYYFGTGLWSGAVILLTGIFGIAASYVRSPLSVKTFMIFAIFGFVVSLAMIALSCGGLDPDSGFYNGVPRDSLWNSICHGAYLGLGVLQIAICILSDAICFYYLFVSRHAEIYSIKLRGKSKPLKRSRPGSKDKNRASTASSAPLIGGSIRPKSGSRNSKKRKSGEENNHIEGDEADMPIKRTRSSFVKSQNGLDSSTPVRSPCIRPPSFFTFGLVDTQERESLIVHPGDNSSVADTNRSEISEFSPYAQTSLFGPPLPIEEDEVLPPYEFVDSQSYTNIQVVTRMNKQECPERELPPSGYQIRRANSAPLHQKNAQRRRKDFRRSAHVRLGTAQSNDETKRQSIDSGTANEFAKYIIDRPDLSTRRSQSDDLLNNNATSAESVQTESYPTQGVQLRTFSKSSDRMIEPGIRENRSQSVMVHRGPRLDRRRRAVSVELKPSKHQRLDNSSDVQRASSSHSPYAGTKTLPSKFSLRTRLSQKGERRSAVPVKSVTSLPIFSPPAKPPRTHSVTLDDLFEDPSSGKNEDPPYESVVEVKKRAQAFDLPPNISDTGKPTEKIFVEVTPYPRLNNIITVDAIKESKPFKTAQPRFTAPVDATSGSKPSGTTQAQWNNTATVNATIENKPVNTPRPRFNDIDMVNAINESKRFKRESMKIDTTQKPPVASVESQRTSKPIENIHQKDSKVEIQPVVNIVRPSREIQPVIIVESQRPSKPIETVQKKDVKIETQSVVNTVKPSKISQPAVPVRSSSAKYREEKENDDVFIAPKTVTAELGRKQSAPKEKSSSVSLDSGPVVKLAMPVDQGPKRIINNKAAASQDNTPGPKKQNTPEISRPVNNANIMVLPTSPVISPPVFNFSKESESISKAKPEPIYSQINKKPPEIMPKSYLQRRSTDATHTMVADNANQDSNKPPSSKSLAASQKEDISGVEFRVRPTPLSPSERILQRTSERPIVNTQGVPTNAERKSVEVGRNLFLPSTEYSGARPKTTRSRTNSEDPDERPIRPFVRDDPRSASYSSHNRPMSYSQSRVSPSQNTSPLPQPFHSKPRFSFVYPSSALTASSASSSKQKATSPPETGKATQSKQGVQTLSNTVHSSASVRPANSSQTQNGARASSGDSVNARPPDSASSQGVLHLTQAQNSRQLADTRNATVNVGAAGNGNVVNVPPPPAPLPQLQQNGQDDGNYPFFSVVL